MATYEWHQAMKGSNILWKLPQAIKMNDNIIVREGETAVFLRDGKAVAYLDRPDRYALTTTNIPYVQSVVQALTGLRQGAEVYYLQRKPFEARFGSKQPYMFRDKEFGLVTLRISGELRWRIGEPANFIGQFVGTEGLVTNDQIQDRIRGQIVVTAFDALGELKEKGMSVLEVPANLLEIEQIVIQKSKPHFSPFGIECMKLSSFDVTLPEEVLDAVSKKNAMNITNTNFMQYQGANAMREAANNPQGGAAAAGVGAGAGMAMGWQMAQSMGMGQGQQQQHAAQQQAPVNIHIGKIGDEHKTADTVIQDSVLHKTAVGGQEMSSDAQAGQKKGVPCVKCGAVLSAGMKFCGECGSKQVAPVCPQCNSPLAPGMKFCGSCGNRVG